MENVETQSVCLRIKTHEKYDFTSLIPFDSYTKNAIKGKIQNVFSRRITFKETLKNGWGERRVDQLPKHKKT